MGYRDHRESGRDRWRGCGNRSWGTPARSWRKTPLARGSERGLDGLDQLRRHIRHDTEPGLEGEPRLVEQQAEPVHSDAAARAGLRQKRRLERRIDEIGGER